MMMMNNTEKQFHQNKTVNLTAKTGTTSMCEFNSSEGRDGCFPSQVITNTGLSGLH